MVVPDRVAERMIMKNLPVLIRAAEAIKQRISILGSDETEEKDESFLQREHE